MMERKDYRALRKGVPPEFRREESRRICQRVLTFPVFQNARTVMAYVPSGSEADIFPLLKEILNAPKTLLLPRCLEGGEMLACPITDLSLLTPGAYGILAPPPSEGFPKDRIDLILAPGVAFDRQCRRIGQGGGYYDRYLRDFSGFSAGIALNVQVFDEIAAQPHDVPLDAVITPEEIILQRKENA